MDRQIENDVSRMTGHIEVLVLDDDPWSLRLTENLLQSRFPDAHVETRECPDVRGDFDVFFIDHDFNGEKLAPKLAAQIREANPKALVIALSATLDANSLKELINAGCNGACDKTASGDLQRALEITEAYLDSAPDPNGPANAGLKGALESIRGLLSEWNTRMETAEEHAA